MKYRARNGAIIDIPKGLNPRQIAQIKADADSGYVTRANRMIERIAGNRKAKGKASEGKIGGTVTKDGTIKTGKADTALQAKEQQDVKDNFNLANPNVSVDQWGNEQRITRDPVTGETRVEQVAGGTASAFRDQALKAAQSFSGDVTRQQAQDAAYGTITKYYERDRARDLEEAKQEMANRGIPYNPAEAFNPNSKDLYGRTIGSINERYQGMKDDAQRQAILAGNQGYLTDATVANNFMNSATSAAQAYGGNFNPYQGTSTDSSGIAQDVMTLSAQQFMQKYGIDKNAAIAREQMANNKAIAGMNSGGGGGGGGFEITG
jgi:hypothetical protein